MVARVDDPDTIFLVDCHILRATKLSGLAAVGAPLHEKLALVRELLDAVEVAVLANEIVAVGIFHNVGYKTEFAWTTSHCATDGVRLDRIAVGVVDEHAKVVRIGHEQSTIAVDRQS